MKFLQTARRRARECRSIVGISAPELLERIEKYLQQKYRIELAAVDAAVIDGGRAELRPDEGILYYDEKLNETPDEKLFVIAHEVGHLELHPRLTVRGCAHPDPVYGSMYGCAGADSLTRYNSRSREEAEANAFAAEFLCPSDEVFRLWLTSADKSAEHLADALGAPIFIVYSQLAEALYQKVFGTENVSAPAKIDDKKCDPNQEAAATFMGAPVLVDAGPGTGKTKTLVRRIEFLLETEKIEPENFLIVTFSNEAATELHERISDKFGEEITGRLTITTFHGFGLAVLQHHGQFQNVDANAYILDDLGQTELLSEIIGKATGRKIVNPKDLDETTGELARHINFLKQRLIMPADLEQTVIEWKPTDDSEKARKRNSEQFLEIFKKYEEIKDQRQRLDFADLILKSINIFRVKPKLVQQYREKYRAVLVDEYQDVSRATAKLLQQICGAANAPWVVGDKRQSIFGFCGAAPDNVDEFENDFPGAKKFSLEINYRSCQEVVDTANQMASLMFKASPNFAAQNGKPLWRADENNPKSFFHPAVLTATANSDEAEYEEIANQVKDWVAQGVPLADIAVLSRRNVDVRDIVLALSARNIPAIASGVVTADGAAGDLAAIVTLADKPQASLPRLAYCLGRGRFDFEVIDDVIKGLRESNDDFGNIKNIKVEGGEELLREIERAFESLQKEKFSGDVFSAMCAFLFDGSDYLRRVFASGDEARRALALGEIIAALMRAASYRFSHRGTPSATARKQFAENFRDSLANSNAPCLSPPMQKGVPAVKVMTCHAAKGLEFPFVIVAGQAHSKRSDKTEYKWLPPHLLPKAIEDQNQADSVLFVGATRARQMLIISYAATSSGLPRAEKRIVTPLLESWRVNFQPTERSWTHPARVQEEVVMPPIWGGRIERSISARNLDNAECSIGIYLHEAMRLDFPVEEKSLYPIFYSVVRRAMNEIVKRAFEQQKTIEKADAFQILIKEWKKSVKPEHRHHDLFLQIAEDYIEAFAKEFVPERGDVKFFDLSLEDNGTGGAVHLDLVCVYQVDDNAPVAILFRPENFDEEDLREIGLLWSSLDGKKRASFALLKTIVPNLRPKIFSGEDRIFYDYQWNSRPKNFDIEVSRLKEKRAALAESRFVAQVKDYRCKKCTGRIGCPHWLKSLI